jgi:hypothetical protein
MWYSLSIDVRHFSFILIKILCRIKENRILFLSEKKFFLEFCRNNIRFNLVGLCCYDNEIVHGEKNNGGYYYFFYRKMKYQVRKR